ncbi:MAG: FkbM family methyltransferase [Candidatus Omnitrophica bacterium]|nr:FkbM family methyltransferase [Candidatus Omnitrophota bacterium]
MDKDWPSLLLRLRWRLARALVPRRRVKTRGLELTLPCDNWMTYYRWKSYNAKEPETLDWIDRGMANGGTLFDIGANIGLYALYAALRHPNARIVAFEPEYSNLHLLRDNILHNSLQDRVEAFSLALSNQTGLSFLHVQDATPGSALHTESQAPLTQTLTHRPVLFREGVGTITLDEFCKKRGLIPQLIKLDVDGTEPAILEGASETLRHKAFQSVLLELSEPAVRAQCAGLLEGLGLRCAWRDPEGLSPNANEIWVRG